MQPTTINPAKAYLLGYRHAMANLECHVREYNRLCRQYDDLQSAWDRATRATSSITAVRVSGTPNHDSMANAVMDIIRLEQQHADSKALYEQYKGKADGTLDWLLDDMQRLADVGLVRLETISLIDDQRLQLLLFWRYFLPHMSWIKIADELSRLTGKHCGEDNVYKLHGKALAEVRRIIGE